MSRRPPRQILGSDWKAAPNDEDWQNEFLRMWDEVFGNRYGEDGCWA